MSIPNTTRYYLKGKTELMPFMLMPKAKISDARLTNGWKVGIPKDIPELPILNNANQRPSTMKVYGCKSEDNTYKVLRREPDEMSMRPHFGFARHQPEGLVFDPKRKLNTPVMKVPHSVLPVGFNPLY